MNNLLITIYSLYKNNPAWGVLKLCCILLWLVNDICKIPLYLLNFVIVFLFDLVIYLFLLIFSHILRFALKNNDFDFSHIDIGYTILFILCIVI